MPSVQPKGGLLFVTLLIIRRTAEMEDFGSQNRCAHLRRAIASNVSAVDRQGGTSERNRA